MEFRSLPVCSNPLGIALHVAFELLLLFSVKSKGISLILLLIAHIKVTKILLATNRYSRYNSGLLVMLPADNAYHKFVYDLGISHFYTY